MDCTTRWTSQEQTPLNPNPNPIIPSIPHEQMYHQPPLSHFFTLPSHFSHQAQTSYPSPFRYFPQPVLPSALTSNPDVHPPGTDPFANSDSYTSNHVGHGVNFRFSEDPNLVSQNWVFEQAEPIRYEPAINLSSENSSVSSNTSSLWNNYLINETLATDATGIIPKQTSVFQSMRCEVCKIDCNSKDVFDKHILGKKHKRNWQVQNNPTIAVLPRNSNATSDIPSQLDRIGGQVIFGPSGMAVGEELETKKRKLLDGGAAVDSVRVCTICNIACNSQEVFNKHLAGKKHASQARLVSLNGVGPYIAAIRAQDGGTWKNNLKKTKVLQSAWCEVCKINCSSTDIYNQHLLGKKHSKNLEKLSKLKNNVTASDSNAPLASTNPIIGPLENPEANKGTSVLQNSRKNEDRSEAPEEDLETKKRKILEGGAAAEAVRTCTVCNVVCNSQTVFISHLAGQKHATMVKRRAEAGSATGGPQLPNAA